MKKTLFMAFLLAFTGCARNPDPATDPTRNLSPEGRAAYHATRVVKALDLLRDIAVSAEAQTPKLLSTSSTRKVVLYHQATLKAMQAVPDGWVAVAQAGLNQLKNELPQKEWQQIDPYARLLLVLFSELSTPRTPPSKEEIDLFGWLNDVPAAVRMTGRSL